jgi:hypothetical protein
VKLKNVRLSFAHLFEPQEGKVDDVTGVKGEPKQLLVPHLEDRRGRQGQLRARQGGGRRGEESQVGQQYPETEAGKICLRDGDQEDYDGYEGMYYVSASNAKQPVLIDRKKTRRRQVDSSRQRRRQSGPRRGRTFSTPAAT